MTKLPEPFIRKIARLLQEEEEDVYVLTLYCLDREDMKFFSEKDQDRVKKIFNVLLEDTRRHADLLRLVVEMGAP